jgi:acetyl-CoA carboxylase biotin carboxyl carrier protein
MEYSKIQMIIRDFENSKLQSLELEFDDVKIKMTKPANEVAYLPGHPFAQLPATPPVSAAHAPQKAAALGFTVKSPLVGTFFSATSPNDPPFVKVGDTVKKGDTLCIVEAMKIMNEITAPIAGKIVMVHAKNGEPIGFDQPLVTIDDAK